LRRLILKRRKTSADLKVLLKLLRKYQSLQYARRRARDFTAEAFRALEPLDGNPVKNDLRDCAEFFVTGITDDPSPFFVSRVISFPMPAVP